MSIVGIIIAVVTLVVIFVMLLRRHIREKYAALWLVIGIGMLVLSLFPGLLSWAAGIFGFEIPSNFLFAFTLLLLSGISLHLSWELSTLESETRRLAEEVAIGRAERQELRERIDRLSTDPIGRAHEPDTNNDS